MYKSWLRYCYLRNFRVIKVSKKHCFSFSRRCSIFMYYFISLSIITKFSLDSVLVIYFSFLRSWNLIGGMNIAKYSPYNIISYDWGTMRNPLRPSWYQYCPNCALDLAVFHKFQRFAICQRRGLSPSCGVRGVSLTDAAVITRVYFTGSAS